jgi:hypothetical protein
LNGALVEVSVSEKMAVTKMEIMGNGRIVSIIANSSEK